ncbi:MAG: type VI secretion system Vgr family protein [Candidatus Bipolaricaulia bacterium]
MSNIASLDGPAIKNLKSSLATPENYDVAVERVSGQEQLSGLFRYTVKFQLINSSDNSPARANFDGVVGQPIVLSFSRKMGKQSSDRSDYRIRNRTVEGIVTRIRQHGRGLRTSEFDTQSHLVEIRPALWRLHLSRSGRTFAGVPVVTKDSEEGVLNQLLDHHGLSYSTAEIGGYEKRKHVSQQGETDLEFFNRIADEAGLTYHFAHGGWYAGNYSSANPGDVVFTDENASFKEYKRIDPNSLKTEHTLEPSKSSVGERTVLNFSFEQNIVPEDVVAESVYYTGGRQVSENTSLTSDEKKEGATGTINESPGGLTWYDQVSPKDTWEGTGKNAGMERVRVDQLQAAQKVFRGRGLSRLLGAGMRFKLGKGSKDVLTHFSTNGTPPDSMEFVTGRVRVEVDSSKFRVEFEAFPKKDPTKSVSPDYRGDRYVERKERAGASDDQDLDPYAFSLQASAGPGNQVQPGIYVATVAELPQKKKQEDQAKEGMIKVKLDLGDRPNEEVWARVLSFWSGSQYGGQFLPREGTKVAIAYPAQDSNEYPFVIGSLYGGMHQMPYSDAPGTKAGIRSQTRRDGENFGNQLIMTDEAKNEELRSVAPKFRTDLTGLEQRVEESKRSYYKLKSKSSLSVFPSGASSYIRKGKYNNLPKKDKKIAHIRPFFEEIKEEYGVHSDMQGSVPGEKTVSELSSGPEKTKFKVKSSVPNKISKHLDNTASLKKFTEKMTEELRIHRKSGDVSWTVVKNDQVVSRVIGQDEYSKLSGKTEFKALTKNSGSEKKKGVNKLKKFIKYVDGSKNPKNGKKYISITISKVGRDAYEDKVRPYRRAYAVSKIGRDAYKVEPYKEAYKDAGKADALGRDAKGKLDVCEGRYQIHTFGDRIEICRVPDEEGSGPLDQEQSGDFKTIKELEEEGGEGNSGGGGGSSGDPILVINKGGDICIQSNQNINIEAVNNINIRSKKGSIKMEAKSEAGEGGKIEQVATEIEIGKEGTTKEIKKRSDHHRETTFKTVEKWSTEAMSIRNERMVITNAVSHMTDTSVHVINTMFGGKHVVGIDNKSVLGLDFKEAIVDTAKNVFNGNESILREKSELSGVKESLAATRQDLAKSDSKLAETTEKVANLGNRVSQNETEIMANGQSILKEAVNISRIENSIASIHSA